MKKSIFALLLPLALLAACTNSKDDAGLEDIPVIEAYLYPGETFSVEIKKLTPYEDESFPEEVNIEALEVYARYNGLTYPLTYSDEGIFTDSTHAIPLQESGYYELTFIYGDQEVYAETAIPEKPQNIAQSTSVVEAFDFGNMTIGQMPEALEITWDNFDASYYLVVVENIETDPVLINEDRDGERLREFRSRPGQIEEFRIMPMQFEYYGKHRIVVFHLNPDYAALYEDQSTNSLNLTVPASNVQNALGIFSGINADTLFVEVE